MLEGIKDEIYYLEDDFFIIIIDEVKFYCEGVKEVVFLYLVFFEVGKGVEIVLRVRKISFIDSGKKLFVFIV